MSARSSKIPLIPHGYQINSDAKKGENSFELTEDESQAHKLIKKSKSTKNRNING